MPATLAPGVGGAVWHRSRKRGRPARAARARRRAARDGRQRQGRSLPQRGCVPQDGYSGDVSSLHGVAVNDVAPTLIATDSVVPQDG